jgi:hypothetical protein
MNGTTTRASVQQATAISHGRRSRFVRFVLASLLTASALLAFGGLAPASAHPAPLWPCSANMGGC